MDCPCVCISVAEAWNALMIIPLGITPWVKWIVLTWGYALTLKKKLPSSFFKKWQKLTPIISPNQKGSDCRLLLSYLLHTRYDDNSLKLTDYPIMWFSRLYTSYLMTVFFSLLFCRLRNCMSYPKFFLWTFWGKTKPILNISRDWFQNTPIPKQSW